MTAGRYVVLCSRSIGPVFGKQNLAHVLQKNIEAGIRQIRCPQCRGHHLSHGHDVRMDARTDLPHQADSRDQPLDFLQGIVKQCRPIEVQVGRKRIVLVPERAE